MGRFLFSFCFLLITISSSARQRSVQEIMNYAWATLQNTNLASTSRTRAEERLEVIERRSQLTLISGDMGFAIITNNDTFPPVMGYSDKAFNANHIAPGFLWWIEETNLMLEQCLANGSEPVKVSPSTVRHKTKVEELMDTQWGQGAPYNNMTPTYTINNQETHFVTGCVATAMAQIMYYHRWPEKGKGSRSYFFNSEDGIRTRANANFGATTYEWNKMLPQYGRGNYTDEEAMAVATIMYHCGVAVKMSYTKDGSGAYTSDARQSLGDYFFYHENLHFYRRDYFPVDEWMDIIFTELTDGKPILYGAQRKDGGHEFVLDGYDESEKVHVNWGWDGSQNGYFDIASLNGYISGQEMVIVRKDDEDIAYESNFGIGNSLSMNQSVWGTVSQANVYAFNMSGRKFVGDVGLIAANLFSGAKTVLASKAATSAYSGSTTIEYITSIEGRGSYIDAISVSFNDVPLTLEAGTYRVYIATKASSETDWQPIRCSEDKNNSYLLTVNNEGKTNLKAENNANWTASVTMDIVLQANDDKSPMIYDLWGRKTQTFGNKGIYIQNRRKVVR